MSFETAIAVKDLGKRYRIYARPLDRARELYSIRGRRYHSEFVALADINFQVKRGETVGIIGPNGSGKSTLLEIICGTLTASSGEVDVNGTVAALLELGAGFNPAFSGRENVYLNAALLGISREQVDARFADIVEFANIGEFIEHPVSTYSSGMYVRLAFATAVNTDPDILIVDEALAVGDIRFQRKCFRKFQEMQQAGKTILFVSHAIELIQSHCSHAIYLRKGKIAANGMPKEVIQAYLEDLFGESSAAEESIGSGLKAAGEGSSAVSLTEHTGMSSSEDSATRSSLHHKAQVADTVRFLDLCPQQRTYNPNEYRWGTGQAVIFDYALRRQDENQDGLFRSGEDLAVEMRVGFNEPLQGLIYGFTVKTVDGRTVYGCNTRARNVATSDRVVGDTIGVTFTFRFNVIPGEYFLSLGVAVDDDTRDNVAIDRRYDLIHVTVTGELGDFGIADLDTTICEYKVSE